MESAKGIAAVLRLVQTAVGPVGMKGADGTGARGLETKTGGKIATVIVMTAAVTVVTAAVTVVTAAVTAATVTVTVVIRTGTEIARETAEETADNRTSN